MQIYRFSLIFHSISELNKEKQPDFAKNFTDDGRRIVKVGVRFSEDRRSLTNQLVVSTSIHFTTILCWMLYIFWFLHQTTTGQRTCKPSRCCISFDSYIKPQRQFLQQGFVCSCISFDSYIKPQLDWHLMINSGSCISFDSYIKPQPSVCYYICITVVYLLIPT